ncbi:MAG: hypothetical protein H0V12_00680 [Chloroflexi bacterium]|nr:hypothetical protein [Chloroflexota bacterium]
MVPGGPVSTALGEGSAPLEALVDELDAVNFAGPVCVALASLGGGSVDELGMIERSVGWLRARLLLAIGTAGVQQAPARAEEGRRRREEFGSASDVVGKSAGTGPSRPRGGSAVFDHQLVQAPMEPVDLQLRDAATCEPRARQGVQQLPASRHDLGPRELIADAEVQLEERRASAPAGRIEHRLVAIAGTLLQWTEMPVRAVQFVRRGRPQG